MGAICPSVPPPCGQAHQPLYCTISEIFYTIATFIHFSEIDLSVKDLDLVLKTVIFQCQINHVKSREMNRTG